MSDFVIVLDGDQRAALAVTRDLGQHGLKVIVCSHHPRPLAGASRWCAKTEIIPDPQSDCSKFFESIEAIASQEQVVAIFALTDASLTAVVKHSTIAGAKLAAPSETRYLAASNKVDLVRRASRLEVPVPATIVFRNESEFRAALEGWHGPVVIKPAKSRYRRGNSIYSTSVMIARDAIEALAKLPELDWIHYMPGLLQEFIPGHGAGIFTLYSENGAVGWFSHRRIREKPPEGGVSVVSESVEVDDLLRDYAKKLLDDIGWTGPAMIEFRIDETGQPWLMEINGRFWGSLQLSIDSGISFPWLWYQTLLGREPPPIVEYHVGNRLRWLLGDLDSRYLMIRSDRYSLSVRVSAAFGFLNFFDSRTRLEVLRMHDPRPFFREFRQWISAALRRNS